MTDLTSTIERLGIGQYQRHILLCTGGKCAEEKDSLELWSFLKKRLLELKATDVYRSKVDCLRICQQGTIALVYPEGTWYANLDQKKLERVINEHLIGGNTIPELAVATNPLQV